MTRDEWEEREVTILAEINKRQEENDQCLEMIQANDQKLEELQRLRAELYRTGYDRQ